MNECNVFAGAYRERLLGNVPRILSQLDRDPDSPTFGCFDRNYWHYKMRDFSSIVLQQGMLVLETLHDLNHQDNPLYRQPLVIDWVDASLRFWASQQLSSGSFNEYYPFEEGYPPTAFSLCAVGLVFKNRGFPLPAASVTGAIQKACDWILDHPEKSALNQESAGLAALALASRIPGIRVDDARLESRFATFFLNQSVEGWFPEYGGADIGYLSVTLDCLWEYHEITGDVRAMAAMERAVNYISHMVSVAGTTPVMINSRNTDYIVPYGLIRLAATNPLAAKIVRVLFKNVGAPSNFLSATDDRYACHYVYQSCFRGLPHLSGMTNEPALLPCERGGTFYFEKSGIFARHLSGHSSIFVAGKKGGILYLYAPQGLLSVDYGWRWKRSDGKVAVSHWQDGSEVVSHSDHETGNTLVVEGRMSVHGWHASTPLRHLLLRVAAFLSGNRLITLLKGAMIFKAPDAGVGYRRDILISDDDVVVTDTFSTAETGMFNPEPAPHYSMRHVASAGNFTCEELLEKTTPIMSAASPGQMITYQSRIVL